VTGPNIVEPLITSVNLVDCANGLATLNFTNLPPGPVDVAVNALDFNGQPVAWATGAAKIKPNETAAITLKCSSTGGDLVIQFDCPELCAGSPSPAPTPTPSPANPIQEGVLQYTTGLTADASGNVYLFGYDPNYTQVPFTTGPNTPWGRIVKIDGGSFETAPTIFDNASFLGFEGEIRGDVLSYYDAFRLRRVNLKTGAVDIQNSVATWGTSPPFNANTLLNTGEMVYAYAIDTAIGAAGYGTIGFLNESKWFYRYTAPDHRVYTPHRPLAMAHDASQNRLLWSSDTGLASMPYDPSCNLGQPCSNVAPDNMYMLNLRSNNEAMYGFCLIDSNASGVLFTKQRNNSVYYWNTVTKAAPTAAFDCEYGSPYRIEKGEDGKFYLMVFEEIVAAPLQGVPTLKSARFRVIRFAYNQATNRLESPTLVVDTMPDKPASF
jgi:hypothetical protein